MDLDRRVLDINDKLSSLVIKNPELADRVTNLIEEIIKRVKDIKNSEIDTQINEVLELLEKILSLWNSPRDSRNRFKLIDKDILEFEFNPERFPIELQKLETFVKIIKWLLWNWVIDDIWIFYLWNWFLSPEFYFKFDWEDLHLQMTKVKWGEIFRKLKKEAWKHFWDIKTSEWNIIILWEKKSRFHFIKLIWNFAIFVKLNDNLELEDSIWEMILWEFKL